MTNKEISDNNPEKELTLDKSISDDKTKQISKKNTTQNKKITPKNYTSTESFDEISNEIFKNFIRNFIKRFSGSIVFWCNFFILRCIFLTNLFGFII